MLQAKNVCKKYVTGSLEQTALDNVSLELRDNEFVAILGPSGSGKTTLLNIIGGLDCYDSGDLIINGISTKEYKDRDWDSYRNHTIGFVFQSYNLIPHQSVLANVELALTISGVSRSERRRKAKEALEKVGLGDQLHKKPNQMSGGQMQRVAIARALVNNPDVLLADEPTGALDTETGIQVMELLKEVAKDRLVVMVTHNPELAENYSTRIIKMLDGRVVGDTAPLSDEERGKAEDCIDTDEARKKYIKKPSMSWATSFGLSLKNLFTKKGRTALAAFAGSIGIIGIALIYAVSQGMTTYINTIQEDTLSSYPLTLEAQHMNMSSLLTAFMGQAESAEAHENDAVYQKAMFYNLVNALNNMEADENDLKAFKTYLENHRNSEQGDAALKEAISGVQYTYNMDMLVYTKNIDGEIIHSDSQKLLQDLLIEYFGMDLTSMLDFQEGIMGGSAMSSMSPGAVLWQEMLSGDNGKLISPLLEKQYDVIYGSWPTEYNEIVLVVDENNEIDDMTLYALGLTSKEDIDALAKAAIDKTSIETKVQKWSYEDICSMKFRTVFNSSCYVFDEVSGTYTDLRDTAAGLQYLYDNGIDLKISGIIRPSEDAVSTMLTGSIGYTHKLTEYIIENSKESAAIKAQLESRDKDIFTGLPFKETSGKLEDQEKVREFKKYINGLDNDKKAAAYIKIMSLPSKEELDSIVENTKKNMDRAKIEDMMTQALSEQMNMGEADIRSYLSAMTDEEMDELFTQMITESTKLQYAKNVEAQMSSMSTAQLVAALDMAMLGYSNEQFAMYYDEVLEFSDSSYDANLEKLGYVNLDSPSTINLFASSFENKDVIEEAITKYNDGVSELKKITYTDYVGLMMSSVTSIIDAVTYVLIAFVAVSLIVSSIMIGVITLISVQERTKEIGILRAIGASKKNVSGMFNAETIIIGFASGMLGIIITYLLCIPINMILHHFTGISNLNAYLPVPTAVALLVISVLLTLVAGIIPSRSAAKKDPVVALRTE
ncbi:MAG: ABC transporter ATP-binding protein/permease [Clostridia bacterium]|nr:ABC transporter ATP-binding protein/permease [Clostridia bacterium]